jgi:hypothetical protein
MMSDTKTASMLQRVPVILAVTASSYGLELKAGGTRKPEAAGDRQRQSRQQGGREGKPGATR